MCSNVRLPPSKRLACATVGQCAVSPCASGHNTPARPSSEGCRYLLLHGAPPVLHGAPPLFASRTGSPRPIEVRTQKNGGATRAPPLSMRLCYTSCGPPKVVQMLPTPWVGSGSNPRSQDFLDGIPSFLWIWPWWAPGGPSESPRRALGEPSESGVLGAEPLEPDPQSLGNSVPRRQTAGLTHRRRVPVDGDYPSTDFRVPTVDG